MGVLADRVMGDRVEIPTLKAYRRRLEHLQLARDAQYLADRRIPISRIAAILKTNRRWIQRILRI